MRYTGHLDLILTWERTFRRSALPLAYSEGFSPRPQIVLAAPLPLGYTSNGEIGDFWLSDSIPKENLQISLDKALPPGLEIKSCREIPDLHGDKLPSLVEAAVYWIDITGSAPNLEERISRLLAKEQITRTRKGKSYDLRPLITDLSCRKAGSSAQYRLEATLTLLPGANGRPDEVVRELGIPVHETLICREQILLRDPDNS